MTFRAYIIRRLALLVFVILGVMAVTFVVSRVIPTDPTALYLGGGRHTPEQKAAAREALGLDKPLVVQFGLYVKDFVRGDWGNSLRTHRPVLGDIMGFLPASLELILSAMALAVVTGISMGAFAAYRKGRLADHTGRVAAIAGVSLPSFFLALVLQIVFFRVLGLLPVAGQLSISVAREYPVTDITGMVVVDSLITGNWVAFWDALRHLILPTLALAAYCAGTTMRMTRSAMLDALESDYARMAYAMGVPDRVIVGRYALKNAMAPVLTVIGLLFAYALVGTFFIEQIFAWPGLGTYATISILNLDYPAIMGVTIIVALAYVTVNLIVDLIIAKLDPRVMLS
ncbi:MAG: ABC transporter permease [Thermoleophilia bacterium]|nr:ABC transporter permease [Thermoleophilia bacterium]